MTHDVPNKDAVAKLLNGVTDSRCRAMVGLMANCGVRTGEIVKLNRDSIVMRKDNVGTVVVPGRRGRRVGYIDPATFEAISEWSRQRDDNSDALFVDRRQRRITPGVVVYLLRRWSSRLGLEPITPRQLRHSFVERLVRLSSQDFPYSALVDHLSVSSCQHLYGDLENQPLVEVMKCLQEDREVPPDLMELLPGKRAILEHWNRLVKRLKGPSEQESGTA